MEEKIYNNLLAFILIIFALEAIFFFVGDSKFKENEKLDGERLQIIENTLNNTPILAKAVSIFNITKNEKIYLKNDETPLPMASLAKIMTVVMGLNGHNMDDIISVSPEAVKQAGDFGILAYEKWKIGDLAKFTLIVSANDGAYALSEQDPNFLENLNNKAKKIGAKNTLFINPTGLDIDTLQAGAFSSAEDVNAMAIYAIRAWPEIFRVTIMPEINLKSESGFEHNFKNTDTLVEKIPNLLFSKTGFTDLAGGNLTIIFKDKRGDEVAITLLGSTFDGRFSDMEKIVNVLYNI